MAVLMYILRTYVGWRAIRTTHIPLCRRAIMDPPSCCISEFRYRCCSSLAINHALRVYVPRRFQVKGGIVPSWKATLSAEPPRAGRMRG